MLKILFICATHGDEKFSIPVLKKLETLFNKEEYSYSWIIGNPRALKKNVRFTDVDLNRSAPGDPKSPNYEERRAADILSLAQNYDLVIDIHGTDSACGVVKIIPYPTSKNIKLAQAIPLKRNVIWYEESSQIKGPIVQHTKIPAIEIECGPKNSPAVSEKLKETLKLILTSNKAGTFFTDDENPPQEFYNVYGLKRGKTSEDVKDFEIIREKGESYYPFLSSNQYQGIICYKLKKLESLATGVLL